MQKKQQVYIQRLRDVSQFLDDHAAQLAGIAGTSARRKLDGYIAEFEANRTNQDESLRTAKSTTVTAQSIVRDLAFGYLGPMSRIARRTSQRARAHRVQAHHA